MKTIIEKRKHNKKVEKIKDIISVAVVTAMMFVMMYVNGLEI